MLMRYGSIISRYLRVCVFCVTRLYWLVGVRRGCSEQAKRSEAVEVSVYDADAVSAHHFTKTARIRRARVNCCVEIDGRVNSLAGMQS